MADDETEKGYTWETEYERTWYLCYVIVQYISLALNLINKMNSIYFTRHAHFVLYW